MVATPPQSTQAPKKRRILLAEHAGYCHGVQKAVNRTLQTGETEATNQKRPVYVLGQLIHNRQVIEKLAAEGIQTVESLDDVPEGSVCVIRTHGSTPELVEAAEAKGVAVSDATCPDVRLVQNKAIQLAEEGYTVVVVGRDDHPEIIGITAHARRVAGAHIVAVNKLEELDEKLADLPKRRIGVVSQTTQLEETFFDMVKHLSQRARELKVFNTICPATFYRQTAAQELAGKVDYMVVIGGKNSSNTTHLAEICRDRGTPTIHIETWRELEPIKTDLEATGAIGVTAGASTPDWLVNEVVDYLEAL